MSDFTFEYPYLLLLIIIFVLLDKFFKQRNDAIIFSNIEIINIVQSRVSSIVLLSKYFAIIFLVVSISSPVIENKIVNNNSNGYNIGLILDSSGSMQEIGFDRANITNNKFDIVKDIVSDFIEKRENDNISIVVFGDFAYVAAPLTYDKEILKGINSTLQIGIAGERTAIYDGIFQSVKILSKVEAKNKIAILLTDGINSAGNIPDDIAIKIAKKYGVKIYTIGIGKRGDFDKVSLLKIAKETNAEFFEANNRNKLEEIYQKIDELEKSKVQQETVVKKDYLYQYTLFVSIIFMLVFIYYKNKN
jgi:Ca-activated chloride channel family protein